MINSGRIDADRLLTVIARQGWTEERAQSFEDEYGAAIRRLVVLNLWRLGFIANRFENAKAANLLSTGKLDLYENTLSDLWIELINGLVKKYVTASAAGKISRPFLAYLAGTIRKLVLANAQRVGLIPRQSEAEMLKAIATSKKEKTRREYVARIKFYFEPIVQDAILSDCPSGQFEQVYRHLPNLTGYFFERYLLSACRPYRPGKRIAKHASDFIHGDYEQGLDYIGDVTPYCAEVSVTQCFPPPNVSMDEFISGLKFRRAGA